MERQQLKSVITHNEKFTRLVFSRDTWDMKMTSGTMKKKGFYVFSPAVCFCTAVHILLTHNGDIPILLHKQQWQFLTLQMNTIWNCSHVHYTWRWLFHHPDSSVCNNKEIQQSPVTHLPSIFPKRYCQNSMNGHYPEDSPKPSLGESIEGHN